MPPPLLFLSFLDRRVGSSLLRPFSAESSLCARQHQIRVGCVVGNFPNSSSHRKSCSHFIGIICLHLLSIRFWHDAFLKMGNWERRMNPGDNILRSWQMAVLMYIRLRREGGGRRGRCKDPGSKALSVDRWRVAWIATRAENRQIGRSYSEQCDH